MEIDKIKDLSKKAFELESLKADIFEIKAATSLNDINPRQRIADNIDFPSIQHIIITGVSKRIEDLQAEIDAA